MNVFELGHTYLQLVHTLNLRLPLVDPSHFISRFASLLEFGEETPKVAADAIRIVQRFDRDWMSKGRRPAGICGASILLAARMNNFRRSMQEIVQVVKIADTTVKQRLSEFKKTPSGALTLADFRTVWLEDEMDPPAYTKGKEREAQQDAEGSSASEAEAEPTGKRRKRKRRRISAPNPAEDNGQSETQQQQQPPPFDPSIFQQGIFGNELGNTPLFLPDDDDRIPLNTQGITDNSNVDPSLLSGISDQIAHVLRSIPDLPSIPEYELQADLAITEEVNGFLTNSQGTSLVDSRVPGVASTTPVSPSDRSTWEI